MKANNTNTTATWNTLNKALSGLKWSQVKKAFKAAGIAPKFDSMDWENFGGVIISTLADAVANGKITIAQIKKAVK